MKSRYAGIWLLISLALAVVLLVYFLDDITIGGWTVRKAPFSQTLFRDRSSDNVVVDSLLTEVNESDQEIVVDSVPKSILIFGDSMTFNLALRLAQYARYNGHTLHSVNWDSSNTKIWADCDTLRNVMERFKVDYVFISLGSNELYFKNPDSRLPYVKKILEVIDSVPYVWIGPPNWKEDSGINDMLEKTCRRGGFFRSAGMTFERKKDHIHPTRAASAVWIDSIMRWLPSSAHPIVMDVPPDSIGKCDPNLILLKALNK